MTFHPKMPYETGLHASALALSPDRGRLFVANAASDTLSATARAPSYRASRPSSGGGISVPR